MQWPFCLWSWKYNLLNWFENFESCLRNCKGLILYCSKGIILQLHVTVDSEWLCLCLFGSSVTKAFSLKSFFCLFIYVCLLSICPSVKLLLLIQNSADHGWAVGDEAYEGIILVDVFMSACLSIICLFVYMSLSNYLYIQSHILNVIVDSKFCKSWLGHRWWRHPPCWRVFVCLFICLCMSIVHFSLC